MARRPREVVDCESHQLAGGVNRLQWLKNRWEGGQYLGNYWFLRL